jgi:hypothetical protein
LKFRTDRAEVAVILPITSGGVLLDKPMDRALSVHDANYVYRQGVENAPRRGFGPNPEPRCGAGLHFFLSINALERYMAETAAVFVRREPGASQTARRPISRLTRFGIFELW